MRDLPSVLLGLEPHVMNMFLLICSVVYHQSHPFLLGSIFLVCFIVLSLFPLCVVLVDVVLLFCFVLHCRCCLFVCLFVCGFSVVFFVMIIAAFSCFTIVLVLLVA